MRIWTGLWVFFAVAPVLAAGVPGEITYQGTLKESGVPVSGTRTMLFRLTNADGTAVYWSGGSTSIQVNQGLFSAVLTPAGVDWQTISPYIEVSVQGQLLLPREPVTATAYALMCGSIANGSVFSGMISLFARDCPAGWTRFSALDGLFPMGGATYGAGGGSAAHSHALLTAGSAVAGGASTVGVAQGSHVLGAWSGGSSFAIDAKQDLTTTQSNLPPYVTVVYCQKQ